MRKVLKSPAAASVAKNGALELINLSGMFLYAEVVLNTLDSLDDIGEIREELGVLPESLEAA
jgi:hypothetical protein